MNTWLLIGIATAVVFIALFFMMRNPAVASASKQTVPRLRDVRVPGGGGAVYGDGSAAGGTLGLGEIWS